MRLTVFLLLTLLFPAHVAAGWFGTNTYDECIIENMKGVTSNVAAHAVKQSCRTKYPKKHPIDIEIVEELTVSLLGNITGHAGVWGGNFSGNIYNGNNGWTISQVTVALTNKTIDKPLTKESIYFDKTDQTTKEYRIDVTVPPLSSTNFSIPVDKHDSEISWYITKAKGYKSP